MLRSSQEVATIVESHETAQPVTLSWWPCRVPRKRAWLCFAGLAFFPACFLASCQGTAPRGQATAPRQQLTLLPVRSAWYIFCWNFTCFAWRREMLCFFGAGSDGSDESGASLTGADLPQMQPGHA